MNHFLVSVIPIIKGHSKVLQCMFVVQKCEKQMWDTKSKSEATMLYAIMTTSPGK